MHHGILGWACVSPLGHTGETSNLGRLILLVRMEIVGSLLGEPGTDKGGPMR